MPEMKAGNSENDAPVFFAFIFEIDVFLFFKIKYFVCWKMLTSEDIFNLLVGPFP